MAETVLTGTEGIGRIIDLENNDKVQASAGYAYWAKLHNLQEQAKTLNYLSENGLLDGAKLDRDLTDADTTRRIVLLTVPASNSLR